jgi:hypothetical protein
MRALGLATLGKERKQFAGGGNSFNIVGENAVRNTGDFRVHLGSTKLFLGYFFICYGFDDIRTSDKHIA